MKVKCSVDKGDEPKHQTERRYRLSVGNRILGILCGGVAARHVGQGLQTPGQCWLRVRENHAVSTASSTRAASARHLDVD